MRALLLCTAIVAVILPLAGNPLEAAPQGHHDDIAFSTSLHGMGIDLLDHHVGVGPGGGCIHEVKLRILGQQEGVFSYRVEAPDMATAHATSLALAVGILNGQSPAQLVGALNQAGFGVKVDFNLAGAIPPGPPQLSAHLVDLVKAAVNVASDRPGGGCEGLQARIDAAMTAVGFVGTCVQ